MDLLRDLYKRLRIFLKKSEDVNVALMEYRNTPITGLNRSPVGLLYLRKLKTKLPIVEKINAKTKKYRDKLIRTKN